MEMLSMTAIWLITAVVFMIIEGIIPGLVSIWFAIGAVAAFISALCGAPLWLQIVWFVVISIAALLLTRPFAKKYVNSRVSPTNADMVIGKECVVKEEINNLASTGSVTIQGKEWTARSVDDSVIPSGSIATVRKIEGVKLIVEIK